MNSIMRLFIIGLILCLAVIPSVSFGGKFKPKDFKFFKWHNPTPRFADLGINMDELIKIIGDTQMLISHKGRSFDLWTSDKDNGKIKSYHNERFVSSLLIINQPKQVVIDHILNFEAYPKQMVQITEGEVAKKDDSNYLVRLKQVYKIVILTLKTDFWYMYTLEENGDFSVLMLDGDVGAGASRFEFIAIDDNRTLLVNTSWLDLDTARFVYRALINAQPDMKSTAPIGAIALTTEQVRAAIDNRDLGPPDGSVKLPKSPDIPVYAKENVPVQAMGRLSDLGTLIFIHPRKWVQTKKGIKSVEFVTTVGQLPGNIEQIKSLSGDFTRFPEYFSDAKKVTTKQLDGVKEIDWKFKYAFGIMPVKVEYITSSVWISKNTAFFEGISGNRGDIDPLHGAWEWIDLSNDKTLIVFSCANHIGEEASWLLKLANKLPNINMLSSLYMGVLIVEKQANWLESQINPESIRVAKISHHK